MGSLATVMLTVTIRYSAYKVEDGKVVKRKCSSVGDREPTHL